MSEKTPNVMLYDDNYDYGEDVMTGHVGSGAGFVYATTTYKPPEEPARVMQIGNVEIWAGAGSEMLKELHLFDMAFDLRGYSSYSANKEVISADERAQKTLPKHLYENVVPPVVSFSWPDGGVLPVSRKWWELLYDWLADEWGAGEDEPKKLAVFCVGGHGRTGTFLSILAAMGGLVHEEDGCPVRWVRETYSDDAVETWGQIDYIEGVTGVAVASIPSKSRKTVVAPAMGKK